MERSYNYYAQLYDLNLSEELVNQTQVLDDEDDLFWNSEYLLVVILTLGCMTVLGLIGNINLMTAICSNMTFRSKSPMVIAICIADCLICIYNIPMTVLILLYPFQMWMADSFMCKLIFFIQTLPITASTLSLVIISLDRYATIQFPQIMSTLHRRSFHLVTAISVWLVSALIAAPGPFIRDIEINPNIPYRSCVDSWASTPQHRYYIFFYLAIIFFIPIVTVNVFHLIIRTKLTALSLTARAKHGELPLPIPLLRRPTHVIIVAGITNNAKVMEYNTRNEFSDEDGHDLVGATIRRERSKKQRSYLASSEKEIRRQNRRLRPIRPPEDVTRTVTSTLKSRRRLGNTLLGAAMLFACLWTPFILTTMYMELAQLEIKSYHYRYHLYTLLLGYFNSIFNPLIYYVLNQQSLKPIGCPTCNLCHLLCRLNCYKRRRSSDEYPGNASSTNEAALGPFNPKLIRNIPLPYRKEQCQNSLQYLY